MCIQRTLVISRLTLNRVLHRPRVFSKSLEYVAISLPKYTSGDIYQWLVTDDQDHSICKNHYKSQDTHPSHLHHGYQRHLKPPTSRIQAAWQEWSPRFSAHSRGNELWRQEMAAMGHRRRSGPSDSLSRPSIKLITTSQALPLLKAAYDRGLNTVSHTSIILFMVKPGA